MSSRVGLGWRGKDGEEKNLRAARYGRRGEKCKDGEVMAASREM